MAGLTGAAEITRDGRTLIAQLMKGVATGGISHIAIGNGTGGAYAGVGVNAAIGNQFEMLGTNPVVIHNDFPFYNFGPNGLIDTFYFIDNTGSNTVNTQRDVSLSFGPNDSGSAILRTNSFNHIFLVDLGASSPSGFGIGATFCAPTPTPVMPTGIPNMICYIGYVQTDSSVISIYNPARMFSEITRTSVVDIEFLGDRAINGPSTLEPLTPSLLDVTIGANPSLLVRSQLSPGLNSTINEIGVWGNGGTALIGWAPIVPGTPITTGESIFIRWALGF